MKRVTEVLWPMIGLGAVAFTFWLLIRDLSDLSLADVVAAVRAISLFHWLFAIASTAMAYAALAWYDQIALAHLGWRLDWRFVGLTSFTTYALAHNIGATVFSGAVIRYRAYSTKGLSAAEVGVLVAFCSFTFTLGNLLLGGLTLLVEPDLLRRYVAWPHWAARALAAALLAVPWFYTLGALLRFRPLRIRGFELVYPRPPIAARQLLAAPLELIGAAGIIYFALPPADHPGFIVVLGVFLVSFSLALVSHAPGGLGVLEYSFISAMPDAPRAGVIAALLVFRLLYLILPLVFSLIVVVLFERGRIGELARARWGG
jgi:glycosyltransferase 2 family protein